MTQLVHRHLDNGGPIVVANSRDHERLGVGHKIISASISTDGDRAALVKLSDQPEILSMKVTTKFSFF